jgi:hypothetical protein
MQLGAEIGTQYGKDVSPIYVVYAYVYMPDSIVKRILDLDTNGTKYISDANARWRNRRRSYQAGDPKSPIAVEAATAPKQGLGDPAGRRVRSSQRNSERSRSVRERGEL